MATTSTPASVELVTTMNILVVDHDRSACAKMAKRLASHGHAPSTVANLGIAIECLRTETYDLALVASTRSRNTLCQFLRQIACNANITTDIVIVRAGGSIPEAVEAIKLGAIDYVSSPISDCDLCRLLDEVEKRGNGVVQDAQTDALPDKSGLGGEVVGHSEAIARVQRMIHVSARTNANVLIYGETGTGKDLIASIIHRQSHRRKKPYVKVGCTLLPPTLIENELFGHEAGSFTGADQPRQGRFELAEGGTIYLDDVDDIPLEQQAKLLRAIEEKEFERVGGTKLIRANVRIIASTKKNLLEKVAKGTFRQDLYYRLDVLRIRIPPLRHHLEDIPPLVDHLLAHFAQGSQCQIEPNAIDVLARHDWPGNVRELAHTLERAILVGGEQITAHLLETEIAGDPTFHRSDVELSQTPTPISGFMAAVEFAEKDLLISALEASGGNKTAAADSIGMKASTFRDKLAKYSQS